MLFKILIVALLALMIYNLVRSLMLMNKNYPSQPPMSKYIGRRLMLSVAIVILLVIGLLTGLITPNQRPY